jgi:hypothetical protein
VAPERYVDGQSLIYGSRALSFVGGPSIGGALVQALSAPLSVAANALSFLGSAFFLGRIRPAEPPADSGSGSVLAGARFIVRSPLVRASLIAVATVNFFNLMFGALYLLYAVRVLHLRAGVVGALLGGLLGSALGLRPALWIATVGGMAGFALLLPTPLPRYRLPAALRLPALRPARCYGRPG